jgi:glycosyltransferase involved in cell wall biosynthesis
LFRHVHDLALGQAQLGAEVGIVFDSRSKGDPVTLSRLADNCVLGLTRMPMSRHVGFGDWRVTGQITKLAAKLGVDVLHGHGAKGGAYARLAARKLKRKGSRVKAIYTPHGGSLHYSQNRPMGRFYVMAERKLLPLTDGFLFESYFAANRYVSLVGEPQCPGRIVPNGLYRHEFYEPMLADDAVDFVFVGELRYLKGVDILLEALAAHQAVFPGRALIVGSGPEEASLKRLARKLGLNGRVSFAGQQSARSAFARARCVVIPSRAESFPYIVLEAAAARMPLITTDAGGIPEIVDDLGMPLIPPGDVEALAGQLRAFLSNPNPFLDRAAVLQKYVGERFTVENMTNSIVDFYISELGAGVS